MHDYFGELLQALSNGQKNYTMEVANKVYVKSGFSVLDTYKAAINRNYKGLFESVDFLQQVATAQACKFLWILNFIHPFQKINGFVEEATHDKIHDLIQPDMLDATTRCVQE